MILTVVIPVYNASDTLARCVDSVLGQKGVELDVVIVDDGSTDDSLSLCRSYRDNDRRVRLVEKANGGLSSARNAALDIAHGDYITFVDSDDFIGPDTYAPLMSIAAEGADMVEYPMVEFYGARWQRNLRFHARQYHFFWDYWFTAHAWRHTYACNKLFRRSLFSGLRFPEGRAFEDVSLTPRLLSDCRRIMTADSGLYYYCYNASGITSTARTAETRQLLEAQLDTFRRVPAEVAERYKSEMPAYYENMLNAQLWLYSQGDHRLLLPEERIGGTWKLNLLNIIGLKNLCKLTTIKQQLIKPRH